MMKAIFAGATALFGTVIAVSCTPAEPPSPYKPVATVEELMEGTVQPAAERYWQSVSTTISAAGIEEKFPKTDEEWEAVWGGAMTIAESGNLLMMPSRVREDPDGHGCQRLWWTSGWRRPKPRARETPKRSSNGARRSTTSAPSAT